jgi:multidrug efflux pump subunit AcrA (membrane-fusion protein)
MGSGSREGAGAPGGGGGGPAAGALGGSEFSLVLQELVRPGSRVTKGQVVAEFDRQYMLTRLDDYRATVEQYESSLGILKANLEVDKNAQQQSILVAKSELDKAEIDLKTLPVQPEIDAEKLKLAAEEAAARHKQLLSEVKFKDISQAAQWKIAEVSRDQSKIELGRAEANADKMLVRAPMDGVTVMSQTIRSGELGQIQQGDSVSSGQLFMRIVDPDSMVVNASINQVDSELIRIGARAKVRFDAYPDLELPAHVYSIGAMPRQGGFRADYVKEVSVVLKLDKMDRRVIPDLSASADVVLASEENANVVPLASIFRDEATGKPFVFLKAPSGWERREVELGLTNNVAAVIRAGLAPGEVIASEWPLKESKN